jgi:type II secretory pathway component PulF
MSASNLELKLAKLLFSSGDRIRIWSKLSQLISNGVPLTAALETLYERSVINKGKSDTISVILKEWLDNLSQGKHFSQSVKDWVSEKEYLFILAGEKGGSIEESLTTAIEVMKVDKEIKGAVIGGALYPVVLVLMAAGISYGFGTGLFPTFLKIASIDKWSGMALYGFIFSEWVTNWFFITLGVIGLTFVLFIISLPRWDGRLRVFLDQYPPYSVYRTILGGSWLISLSAMVKAGLRVEDALEATAKNASPWLKTRIKACLSGMTKGYNMGDSLSRSGHGFPDKEIIDDLGVYSSISGFDDALATLGRESSTETVKRIKAQSKVMFLVGLTFAAGLLGFLISSLMSMQLQMQAVLSM